MCFPRQLTSNVSVLYQSDGTIRILYFAADVTIMCRELNNYLPMLPMFILTTASRPKDLPSGVTHLCNFSVSEHTHSNSAGIYTCRPSAFVNDWPIIHGYVRNVKGRSELLQYGSVLQPSSRSWAPDQKPAAALFMKYISIPNQFEARITYIAAVVDRTCSRRIGSRFPT